MSDLTEEKITELRAKFGRVVVTRYNGQDIAFRKPNANEAQMYRTAPADNEDQRYERTASLAQFIVVFPSLQEWNDLLDDYPFAISSEPINNAIAKAMGVLEEKKDSTPRARPSASTPSDSRSASPSGSPSSPGVS